VPILSLKYGLPRLSRAISFWELNPKLSTLLLPIDTELFTTPLIIVAAGGVLKPIQVLLFP